MPRTSASGDDTVVGQTVLSTTVDPSSGIGATHSASSSDVNKTVDAGKLDLASRKDRRSAQEGCCCGEYFPKKASVSGDDACPQIWHQGICPNKSSCISSLELVCVGSILNLVVCNYFVFAEMRSWERT